MRHVILASLAAAVWVAVGCGGGSRVPWAQNINAAQSIATDRNTLVMVVFAASDQKICKVFEDETLSDPAVLERIREYVPVRMDIAETQAKALGARLQVPAVPAVFFIRPNSDIVHRCMGAMKVAAFMKELDKVDAEMKLTAVPLK